MSAEDRLPESIWSGSFSLSGVEVKCHVLDNGQRIIDAESVEAIFEHLNSAQPGEIEAFSRFVKGKGVPNA